MKALEKRAADAEIEALRLQWENERLVKALRARARSQRCEGQRAQHSPALRKQDTWLKTHFCLIPQG
jgi:hypothetical protein